MRRNCSNGRHVGVACCRTSWEQAGDSLRQLFNEAVVVFYVGAAIILIVAGIVGVIGKVNQALMGDGVGECVYDEVMDDSNWLTLPGDDISTGWTTFTEAGDIVECVPTADEEADAVNAA